MTDIDAVDLKVLHNQFVAVCREMAIAMMRTAYSPIFSESLDFATIVFDPSGEMIAMADMNPAMLGSAALSGRWIIDEVGTDNIRPGDVIVDNDPYRGMCHMPEHLLLAPCYVDDELVCFVGAVGHLGEIGGMAAGSFATEATDIYQEGLRLPPVHLMRAGEHVRDVWRIVLANHRTPTVSWGDLHAMIGALRIGIARVQELCERWGASVILRAPDALHAYAERWIRSEIRDLPDGQWEASDVIEDDGVTTIASTIKVAVTIDGDEVVIDFAGSSPQARGPINAPYTVTFAAACNGFFQLFRRFPINAGTFRPLHVIAPPGSVVNVTAPAPCVGGQTEVQPRIIDLVQGACLGQVMPERVAAAGGGTCSNLLLAGVLPSGEFFTHYHFDGSGWGGRHDHDGNSACNAPHSNCPNTPIEVFEARFPLRNIYYRLRPDSGGAGQWRGGLGIERELEVLCEELGVSALYERMRVRPWGVREGRPGLPTQLAVRRAGDDTYRSFTEAFNTISPSKFANVVLRRGDRIRIFTPGGGGYGSPEQRSAAAIDADIAQGWVTPEGARRDYGYGQGRSTT